MTSPVAPSSRSPRVRPDVARPPQRGRPYSAVAGAVGAALALGAAEVIAGLAGRAVASAVVAVGDAVVDLTPGPAVRTGIDTLGTADKPILLVGIVSVTVLLGAVLAAAPSDRHRPAWLLGGFEGMALVALWAAAREPGAVPVGPALAYALAAALGGAVALLLVRVAPAERPSGAGTSAAPLPAAAVAAPERRAFLALAGGGTVLAATAGLAGQRLRRLSSVTGARRSLALPAAGPPPTPAAMPAGFADVGGLGPFVTPNKDFYRIDTALVVPQLDPAAWRLRVTGLVEEEVSFRFDDLAAMTVVEQQVTLSCVSNEVGGELVGNANWRGVQLADVLSRAGVRPEATQVIGESADGFTAGFPLSVALDGRPALVALGMNGELLPVAHGFPCRLVVAGLYGYVSATKWLTELRLTRWEGEDGYWIPRGWAKEGPVKTQSRIDVPRRGMELPVGTVAVAGVAWAPTRGIARVELRVDDGPWEPAELSAGPTDATWVQWLYRWSTRPGAHRLTVRATDGTGATQPAQLSDVAPDGATGHHSIEVEVA